jgi:hypothetical protein
MHPAKQILIALLLSSIVGCGAVTDDQPKTVTPPSSTEAIKAVLNDLAQTGQMSSGVMTLETEIEKLRPTDAAKADKLKQDYEQLKTLNNPAQIQAKAKEMLTKL